MLPPLFIFGSLMAMAMSSYPGGTWEDPRTSGHSQVRNFLCDLTRPIALNGVQNEEGARYADLGLLAFSVALIPFFLIVPAVFPDRRKAGIIAACAGTLAGLGGVGIVMVPSYRFGSLLHGLMILLAAIPGLTAASSATIGVFSTRSPIRPIRAAAMATLVATAAAVVVFAIQLARGLETTPGLPVLEKLAIGCTVGWMVLTVAAVYPGRSVKV